MTELERVKAWRQRNPEKFREQKRRNRQRHPDQVKAWKAPYRSKYREKLNTKRREKSAMQLRLPPDCLEYIEAGLSVVNSGDFERGYFITLYQGKRQVDRLKGEPLWPD